MRGGQILPADALSRAPQPTGKPTCSQDWPPLQNILALDSFLALPSGCQERSVGRSVAGDRVYIGECRSRKPIQLEVNGPIQFAVDKDHIFILDYERKEFRLNIIKTTLKTR